VLAYEPPDRILLGWQLNTEWEHDPALTTELEVRFVGEGPTTTRVELEHRDMHKFGDQAAEMRAAFDAPDGWTGLLAAYGDAF
jgi:uncharacterized protein YndB with AHSA1/START domain